MRRLFLSMDELARLTSAILQRLRDPQADFRLQAIVRDQGHTLWLTKRASSVSLVVLDAGGAEVDWAESAFRDLNPQQAYDQLADRIIMVALYAGGPFPDDLMAVFVPDESQPLATYKAEWHDWPAFTSWLKAPARGT